MEQTTEYPSLIKLKINKDTCFGKLRHFNTCGVVYQLDIKGSHILIPAKKAKKYEKGQFQYIYHNGHHSLDRVD